MTYVDQDIPVTRDAGPRPQVQPSRVDAWACHPCYAMAAVAMAFVLFRLAVVHDWLSVWLVLFGFGLTFVALFPVDLPRARGALSTDRRPEAARLADGHVDEAGQV